MSNDQDGGILVQVIRPDGGLQYFGMNLREYFAAKAMQGILSGDWEKHGDVFNVSAQAFKIADAMLVERRQTRTLEAAASDLLEACELHINTLRSQIRDGKDRPEFAEGLYQAERKMTSAIAKAKGVAQ